MLIFMLNFLTCITGILYLHTQKFCRVQLQQKMRNLGRDMRPKTSYTVLQVRQ